MRSDVVALYVDPRVQVRFWAKVCPEALTGCWLWTGSADRKGYGKLSVGSKLTGSKRPHSAHRISWALHRGALPAELSVLHRCDTPACVNPDHLFLGTVADNNRDMWAKGRGVLRPMSGADNPAAKLTAAAVREIRASHFSGAHLARLYGVSRSAIHLIRKGARWTTV